MTPYEIEVLVHYECQGSDHPDMKAGAPPWRQTIDEFIGAGLLKQNMLGATAVQSAYSITEKGRVYVNEGLCKVPLPVQTWHIPGREA